MSNVNVNLHGLEHSHQLVQKLLSILAYELTFLIYFTYFSKYPTSNYLFYIIFH